jgi:hypothetical protein
MNPTIAGQTIISAELVAYYLELHTAEGGQLKIENEYQLESPGHPTLDTSRGDETAIIDALQSATPVKIVEMDTSGGGLVLTLEGERRIRVEMTRAGEAWGYVGPRYERVISMPGGELAIWDPIED